MEVVLVDESQLKTVHKLAHEIWPHTFANILSASQITYMLNWMYSLDSLKKQLKSGHHFILAKEGEVFLGYASYEFYYKNQPKTKLHKIYVHPESQGKGVGKLLMDYTIQQSVAKGLFTLSLNVNRNNKAVAFYKKLGFVIAGEENIAIGEGYLMEDYIMEKQL